MSRKPAPEDKRFKFAADLLILAPTLKVTEAMRAKKFSDEEAKDPGLQMRVRRLRSKLKNMEKNKKEEIISIPDMVNAGGSDVSTTTSPLTTNSKSSVASKRKEYFIANAYHSLTTSESTASTNKKKNKLPPGVKRIRSTAKQAQQKRINQKTINENEKAAHKKATQIYAQERKKPKGRSATEVSRIVNLEFGSSLSGRSVLRYVANGMAGESPMKRGPTGGLSSSVFKLLQLAFESFVRIKQANADSSSNTRMSLQRLVNSTVSVVLDTDTDNLLNRLLRDSKIDLQASVENPVEERRIRWTTFSNLSMWFENWRIDLEALCFGFHDEGTNDFIIPEEQLRRIINLDESCLSLDGSSGRRGGRPSVSFFDPNLPRLGKAATKSSVTTTFISGSTAYGEALPPHFQFSTKAKTIEKERVRLEAVQFMKSVRGEFGNRDDSGSYVDKVWPTTIGLNEKGGMDEDEFEKYILNSILPLYPDVEDKDGKRVIIKIDSGPGRLNMNLLARLRNVGFILYPGVPNTTAITQETDQSYGLFKSKFRQNLEKITQHRIKNDKTVSILPWMVGLLVFGGVDPVTTCTGYHNAFEIAFSKEKNLSAWGKIGAAPLTMACLTSSQVRHEIGDEGDPLGGMYRAMETQNNMATNMLNSRGFIGDLLKVKLKRKVNDGRTLTVAHTKERVDALAKAKTHGEKFYVTGGSHATHDDMFKAAEVANRKAEIVEMKKNKELRETAEKREKEGFVVVEKEIEIEKMKKPELESLLLWYGIKKTDHGNLPEMKARWKKIRHDNTPPPTYKKWTEEDERGLTKLETEEIDMVDTALGRLRKLKKLEMEAAYKAMNGQERSDFMQQLGRMDEDVVDNDEEVEEINQSDNIEN